MFKQVSRAWCIGFPSALIAIGLLGAPVIYFLTPKKVEYAIFLLLVSGLSAAYLVEYLRRDKMLRTFADMSYDNYKLRHPDNVRSNRITCFNCGGNRLNIRAMMDQLYHREHVCVQCGTTLYYTPEQGRGN